MPRTARTTRTIRCDYLARVEGEGALYVRIRDGCLQDVKLKIFEPPRFFEALLRGRRHLEAPDITARICGICPVAYQMSACHAIENALGITVGGPLRELRRLLYCGEWIESHVLHVFMLHAPDFLGYESAIHMARDHGDLVQMGLRLKKIGNDIGALLGGREIHPINVRVGGFYRVPERRELQRLVEDLTWACDAAEKAARWVATLPFPDFEQDYEYVALRHPAEYPFNEGRLVSSGALDIAVSEYEQCFVEEHVAHSNALHSAMRGRGAYFVGPLARYSLNFARLTARAQHVARACGLGETCWNPFQSIIVRCIETLYACEEALRIIASYERPERPFVDAPAFPGRGFGCTEAPRGILYHRYQLADDGTITDARIVPPTAQNQKTIENDLRGLVPRYLDLSDSELQWRCEQAIRNYDPCISCATHFLRLDVDRGGAAAVP
ncbi:MAG: Ni/Fe hydrogenase subunit alpha [Candidatus Schekmanbacteria bacterium]|nr:Ni/Fe hydrogenase subunit alpha [Candidatus Schekmanbacteria bacterium]